MQKDGLLEKGKEYFAVYVWSDMGLTADGVVYYPYVEILKLKLVKTGPAVSLFTVENSATKRRVTVLNDRIESELSCDPNVAFDLAIKRLNSESDEKELIALLATQKMFNMAYEIGYSDRETIGDFHFPDDLYFPEDDEL